MGLRRGPENASIIESTSLYSVSQTICGPLLILVARPLVETRASRKHCKKFCTLISLPTRGLVRPLAEWSTWPLYKGLLSLATAPAAPHSPHPSSPLSSACFFAANIPFKQIYSSCLHLPCHRLDRYVCRRHCFNQGMLLIAWTHRSLHTRCNRDE